MFQRASQTFRSGKNVAKNVPRPRLGVARAKVSTPGVAKVKKIMVWG